MAVSKVFFVAAGFVFLALGITGIALPILPAAPFLLAASFCFLKGSVRLYRWLMSNPRLGPKIERIRTHGLTGREKAGVYITACVFIIPVIVLSSSLHLRIFLILLLVIKGIVFLVMRTAPRPPS
ncbi:MAG: YbaN family protein [Treponema sp.]|nr:YbaN family protein [Treponema sp.]